MRLVTSGLIRNIPSFTPRSRRLRGRWSQPVSARHLSQLWALRKRKKIIGRIIVRPSLEIFSAEVNGDYNVNCMTFYTDVKFVSPTLDLRDGLCFRQFPVLPIMDTANRLNPRMWIMVRRTFVYARHLIARCHFMSSLQVLPGEAITAKLKNPSDFCNAR